MKKLIIWFLLLPLLNARWSWLLFLPICIYLGITHEEMGIIGALSLDALLYMIWMVVFGFIFGNCEAMIPITLWIVKILGVNFKRNKDWAMRDDIGYTINKYPSIEIHNKEYKLTVPYMGGALYDYEANLRRKIIFIWLFNH